MDNNQIQAFLDSGELTRKCVGDGLYLRVQTVGHANWEVRYSVNGRRRVIALEGGKYPQLSLLDAQTEAMKIKWLAKAGIDPLVERNRLKQAPISTVDELFSDWYPSLETTLKHPEVTLRIYNNEIKPVIGEMPISNVRPQDIQAVLHKVVQSNRPTTANDTLSRTKQLFNHAYKLGLISRNPALLFNDLDAGGKEKSRERVLSMKELTEVFKVLRNNMGIFTRDNYLAVALLVTLGVSKGELIAAQWSEFDFDNKLWKLPEEHSKTGVAITIPLPDLIIPWFKELYVRANGSDYLFPSRRISKRRGYISDDTLNHALGKMFGNKVDRNKQLSENLLGRVGVEHFTINDLRRTCRSLLMKTDTDPYIVDRCLNYKVRRLDGVYDSHDYLDKRTEAISKLAALVAPLIDTPSNPAPFKEWL